MSAPVVLGDEDFARLRLLLSRAAGLVFDDSRRESLAYSISERLRETGLPDVASYLDLVERAGSPERQALLDEVTVQETHFFRNPPQVRALRAHVLPELLREAGTSKRLRIWSAGCSTGEEPYTIAMLLRELLPSTDGWDIEVLGTDVSERALEAARSGRYGDRALHLADPDEVARHFVRTDDGRWEVRPEVRELVRFRHANLVTEPVPYGPAERVDLVLCRNVTIYFDRETTRSLMTRLHGCLRDGGYLFLGHSETLWQVSDEFRLVALGSGEFPAFVYRRLDVDVDVPERRRVLPDRRTADEPVPPPDRRLGARRAWERLTSRPAPPAVPRPRPVQTRGHETAVRASLASGDYAAAAERCAVWTDAEPFAPRAHYLHGLALVDLGQDAQAITALRRAVYLDPDAGLAHFLLAGALARLGDAVAASREYVAAADSLGRQPPEATAPELGGRSVAELARLCAQLGSQLGSRVDTRLGAPLDRSATS